MWAALDEQKVGFITTGRFGQFMRRGEPEAESAGVRWRPDQLREEAGQVRVEAETAHCTGFTVEVASQEEVMALAELFNRRLERLHQVHDGPSKRSWIKLFNQMDGEKSGRITYIELVAMVRNELQFSPRDLPGGVLRAVWAALDTDGLDFVTTGEFGAFMRRGEGVLEARVHPLEARRAQSVQLRATLEAEGSHWMREAAREAARETREAAREAERLEEVLRFERDTLQELASRNAARASSLMRSSGVANPTARPLSVTAHPPRAVPAAPAAPRPPPARGSSARAPARVVSGGPRPSCDEVLELRQRLHRAADADADADADGWCESRTLLHLPPTRGSASTDLPTLHGPPTTTRPGTRGTDSTGASPIGRRLPVRGPPSSARFASPRPPASARPVRF